MLVSSLFVCLFVFLIYVGFTYRGGVIDKEVKFVRAVETSASLVVVHRQGSEIREPRADVSAVGVVNVCRG